MPVAYEVARGLRAPLDVFVVRKLGLPGHEELAMGAIASGGVRVVNESPGRRRAAPARGGPARRGAGTSTGIAVLLNERAVAVADLNADGRPDAAVANALTDRGRARAGWAARRRR